MEEKEDEKGYRSTKRPKKDGMVTQWATKLKLDGDFVSPGALQSTRAAVVSLSAPKGSPNGNYHLFVASKNLVYGLQVILIYHN
jgi:hypothetical protein